MKLWLDGADRKCVIVIRVSTDQQTNGTSLDAQEMWCRAFAASMGWEVVAVFREEGDSGSLYLYREQLQGALDLIRRGEVRNFIAPRVDRAGRDVDVCRRLAKEVSSMGGHLFFAEDHGTETRADKHEDLLQLTFKAMFAENERFVIKARTMQGRRKRAEKDGQQPSRSRVPYGYHIPTHADITRRDYPADMLGKYVVIEEQARWVREIFRQFAAGTCLRPIATWLEEQEVPRPKGGEFWRASTVRGLLKNPVYKGQPIWGRREYTTNEEKAKKEGKKSPTYVEAAPEEQWVTLESPAIVSAELWDVCQERLEKNKEESSGSRQNRYTLSGLMRCSSCHRRMRADGGNGAPCYCCHDDAPCRNARKRVCNPKRHLARIVEPLVLDSLRLIAHHPELAADALRAFERHEALNHPAGDDPDRLREQLRRLTADEEAVVDAELEARREKRSTALYTAKLVRIHEDRRTLTARLAAAESTETKPNIAAHATSRAAKLSAVLEDVELALTAPELTRAERNDLLRTVIHAIWPEDDGYTIEVPLPSSASPDFDVSQMLPSVQMISILCPPGASR